MNLASIEDVEKALGSGIPQKDRTRVEFILEKLSTAFKKRARQTFTVEIYTHELKVNRGVVLPNRVPLLEVLNVEDRQENEVGFTVRAGKIRLSSTEPDFVLVTYKAGYATVPDDVRLQIADSARRIYQIPDFAHNAITQHTESTGPFSETHQVATWAVGGQTMLSPDDIALADSYRAQHVGNVWWVL